MVEMCPTYILGLEYSIFIESNGGCGLDPYRHRMSRKCFLERWETLFLYFLETTDGVIPAFELTEMF